MSDADPMIGRTIAEGRYEIVKTLGEGGMGAVYQARQVAMDRMVALKVIRAEVVQSQQAIGRFHQEMKATAKIEHANTIRVYDFGRTNEGQLFLAMEFLAGRTLGQTLEKDGALPLARVVHIGAQVARAIGAAHAEGIVHRDLKPDNVMLLDRYGETDFVKVLDFGIARSLDENRTQMTAAGGVIGTPAYMSPEQAMGQPIDTRTDLYSLGVMLYQMVSGTVPFTSPTTVGLLVAHANEPPPPIAEKVPGMAPPLAQLIMQLLAKAPADRPQTAAEIASRLEECAGGAPATVPPTRMQRKAPSKTAGAPSGSKLPIAVGVGALLVAGGAGALYLSKRHGDDPSAQHSRQIFDGWLARAALAAAPDECKTRDPGTLAALADATAQPPPAHERAALTGSQAAEALAMVARDQLAAHDVDGALATAKRAVAACPKYVLAHHYVGYASHKKGDLDEAESSYARALQLGDFRPSRFDLGLVQLQRKDWPSAIGTFSRLIEGDPNYHDAYTMRAQANLMAHHLDEALADAGQATEREPQNGPAWLVLGNTRAVTHQGDAEAAFCEASRLGASAAAELCKKGRK